MEKTFSFRTETSSSVEFDQHNKLLNELGAEGWNLVNVVYKAPSRYSDGKFYFYFSKEN